MNWNRYYTSPSTFASFIFGELCYKEPIDIITELTGIENSYASYLDRENKVLSEHVKYSEDTSKAQFGYKFFLDDHKRNDYFAKTLEIIDKSQNFVKHIESLNFDSLSIVDVHEIVERAEFIYNESMGYYFLSQPEYTAKLNKVFLLNLETHVPKEKVQEVFITLIESDKISVLEYERIDWLENILLPYLENNTSFDKEPVIRDHVAKFKWLVASAQSKPWDERHFYKVLEDEKSKSVDELKQELSDIKSKEVRIKQKKSEIVKNYGIPHDLVRSINILAELGSLRLEAHLKGWQFFQYFGPVLVEKTAELMSLDKEDVFNLTLSEFKQLLKGDLIIDEKIIARRGGNILAITTPEKGEENLFGNEAKERYELDFKEHMQDVSEFFGQTVNGSGKLTGEVFVFRWGADDIEKKIYDFPEGKILVAGQTLPLFMPAIRKCIAIVTNEGGVLCHAAIVSRELSKPAIIGTKIATEMLKDGDVVEMDLDNQKITIVTKK
jgi:phosphohistidine swiveling domain-containing protein